MPSHRGFFAPGDANAVQRLIRANQAFQAYFFTAAHNMLNSVPSPLCDLRLPLHVLFFVIAHPRPWQWNEEVQEGVGLELGDGRSSLLRSRAKFCSEVLPVLLAQQQRNNQSIISDFPPPTSHTTGECVHTSGVLVCAPLRRQQGDLRLQSLLLFALPHPHTTSRLCFCRPQNKKIAQVQLECLEQSLRFLVTQVRRQPLRVVGVRRHLD